METALCRLGALFFASNQPFCPWVRPNFPICCKSQTPYVKADSFYRTSIKKLFGLDLWRDREGSTSELRSRVLELRGSAFFLPGVSTVFKISAACCVTRPMIELTYVRVSGQGGR